VLLWIGHVDMRLSVPMGKRSGALPTHEPGSTPGMPRTGKDELDIGEVATYNARYVADAKMT
jgi:hypothetical protein